MTNNAINENNNNIDIYMTIWLNHGYLLKLEQSAENRVNLTRLVPFEMRALVCQMLECEPHLRPAANFVIQVSLTQLSDSLYHWQNKHKYISLS